MRDFGTLLFCILSILADSVVAQVSELKPAPGLSPEEVVRFQIGALQHNDDPHPDAGIERTFRFASPSNKSVTGPLEHFVQIVKSAAYLPMINCQECSVVGSQIEGDRAKVITRIQPGAGPERIYLFLLTKQQSGEFADCWMTDSVVPVASGESKPEETMTI